MGFKRRQQPIYRPLVAAAWAAHARAETLDPDDAAARRLWYESQLLACVGVTSTVPLDAARDFDCAAAHFESLADDGRYYWQQRAETGDHRRILRAVFGPRHCDPANPPEIAGTQFTARYCSGIARQALNVPEPPLLRTLSKPQLKAVIRAIAIHARRHGFTRSH